MKAQTTADFESPKGRRPLPYPNGWFAVGYSHELKAGQVRITRFMDEELVMYRTASGQAHVVEPYCPHLGAHLGHGGRVEGEDLICPYHGLAFAPGGDCVRCEHGVKPPRVSLSTRQVQEVNGMLLLWQDSAGLAPTWQIPEVDVRGYSNFQHNYYEFGGYVQDLAENSTDLLHFKSVHRLKDVSVNQEIDGIRLTTEVNARAGKMPVQLIFSLYGLGCIMVKTTVPSLGVQIASMAYTTQVAPLRWTLRFADALRLECLASLPAALRQPLQNTAVFLVERWFQKLAAQDQRILSHRKYLERPKLMIEERTTAEFRRWSKQFYPRSELAEQAATPAHAPSQPVFFHTKAGT